MDASEIKSELAFRARSRGENVNSREVQERINIGVQWELNDSRQYDKVIYNPRDNAAQAVAELAEWFAVDQKPLTILSGPSFVGKGTLIRALLTKERHVRKIVLWTTRGVRTGEGPEDYVFADGESLQSLADRGSHLVLPVYHTGDGVWIGLKYDNLYEAFTGQSALYLLETTPDMMARVANMYPTLVRTVFISCVPHCAGDDSRQLVETYEHTGHNSLGVSFSGNDAVLHAAAEWYRRAGVSPDLDEHQRDQIAHSAAGWESLRAGGHRIGSGDVYTIVHGGVGLVHTSASEASFEAVAHDPVWIEEHLVWSHRKNANRHDAGNILARLFCDGAIARTYVRLISSSAFQAAAAIATSDADGLAAAIKRYVRDFDQWLGGGLTHPSVEQVSHQLRKRLGEKLLATKPLGAGSAESLCVLLRDKEAAEQAGKVLTENGWDVHAVRVAGKLDCRIRASKLIISAPHRLDLVAAADLSIDPAIGCHGVCCAIAIEPRSTVTTERRLEVV